MTLASRIAVMRGSEVQRFADPRLPSQSIRRPLHGDPPVNTLTARLEAGANHLEAVVENGTQLSHRLSLMGMSETIRPWIDREEMVGMRFRGEPAHPRKMAGVLDDIDAMVGVTEPTGAESMALIRLGTQTVMARLNSDIDPQAGTPMRLRLDLREPCLFGSASERAEAAGISLQ